MPLPPSPRLSTSSISTSTPPTAYVHCPTCGKAVSHPLITHLPLLLLPSRAFRVSSTSRTNGSSTRTPIPASLLETQPARCAVQRCDFGHESRLVLTAKYNTISKSGKIKLADDRSSNYTTPSRKHDASYGRKTHQRSRCSSFVSQKTKVAPGCHASCLPACPVFVPGQSVGTFEEI